MQNYSKNFVARTLAWILAVVMVVSMIPMNVLANGFSRWEKEALGSNPVAPKETSERNQTFENMFWNEGGTFEENSGLETSEDEVLPALQEPNSIPGIAVRAVDAEGKPPVDWDKTEGQDKDDGSEYWPLPTGVKVIHAQNNAEPVNTVGITYLGKYKTDEGKTVLKLNVSQDNSYTTAVWKQYVMRLPRELSQAVDWSKSYIVVKRGENWQVDYLKFTDSTIQQSAYNKQFSFIPRGSGYINYELNLVVGDESALDGRAQVVQLRLFDKDGKRIYSTSHKNSSNLAKFGYNTHTKTAVIGNTLKKPSDLMESTTISRAGINATDEMFRTTYSVMQLDKANGKVRIIYVPTKSPTGLPLDSYNYRKEKLAIRQTFDREFINFLDLTKKVDKSKKRIETEIGEFYVLDNNEKTLGKRIKLFAKDINGIAKDAENNIEFDSNGRPKYTRSDQSVFIQLSEYGFDDKENGKLDSTDPNKITNKDQPKGEAKNIFMNGSTIDGYYVVFEYNIDPEKINSSMIAAGQFIKNFAFDTRYITDNNEGMRKFTAKVNQSVGIGPNTMAFMRISFDPDQDVWTAMTAGYQDQDFMVNIGGTEGNWYSWKREGAEQLTVNKKHTYYIPLYGYQSWKTAADSQKPLAGKMLKKDDEVAVYLPKRYNADHVKFDIVTVNGNPSDTNTVVTPILNTRLNLTKQIDVNTGSDIYHFPMYMKNTVSTIGGSAVREQYAPIVNEIFTDSENFTGITRTEGGVFSQTNNTKPNDRIKYFGSNWMNLDIEYESLTNAQEKSGVIPNITKMTFTSLDGKLYLAGVEQKENKTTYVYDYKYNNQRQLTSIVLTTTEYNYDKKTDKVNKVTTTDTFTGPDAQDTAEKLEAVREKVYFNNKEYNGYKFDIENQYFGGVDYGKSANPSNVQKLKLIKDQAVMFSTYKLTSLKSEPVYEQVQAKVDFEIYPKTENSNGLSIERIVPLNREYSIVPEVIKRNEHGEEVVDAAAKLNVGKPNPTYEPNGFDWKEKVNKEALDRNPIRVDEKDATVDLNRPLAKELFNGETVENSETYPNFINHDGGTYDINSDNNVIKAKERREFIKRLFPDSRYDKELLADVPDKTSKELVQRSDGSKVIGWTTKRLEGSEEDQYKEYLKLKKSGKVIRKLEDWDLIDADASKKTVYVFDRYSPVKDRRTVYAVRGSGLNITLYANRTKNSDMSAIKNDVLEHNIIIKQEDLDHADSVNSAGELDPNGDYKLIKLPMAPYNAKSANINKADTNLRNFINGSRTTDSEQFKDRYTFVGWTNSKEDKLELRNSNLQNKAVDTKKMTLDSLLKPNANNESVTFLTNGGGLILPKNIEDINYDMIDLYAQYRPYFRVQLHKVTDHSQRDVDDHRKPGPGTPPDAITRPTVQIGLLHRTAVTEVEKPTVGNVSYFPIDKDEYGKNALKLYMNAYVGHAATPDTFDWYVPGYDDQGERISYVGVEFPVRNGINGITMASSMSENLVTYYKFEKNWSDLGITTRTLNHESMGSSGIAKMQTITVDGTRAGANIPDTYTGATQRVPIDNLDKKANAGNMAQQWTSYIDAVNKKQKYELVGYNILMTNTYTNKYNPIVDDINHNDTKFTVKDVFKSVSKTSETLQVLQLKVKPSNSDSEKIYNFVYDASSKTFNLLSDTTWDLSKTADLNNESSYESNPSRLNEIIIDNSYKTDQNKSVSFTLGNQKHFIYNKVKSENGYVTARLSFGSASESDESTMYVNPSLSQAARFNEQLKTTYKAPQGMSQEDFNSLSENDKKLKGDPESYNLEAQITDEYVFPAKGSKYSVYKKSDITETRVGEETVKELKDGAVSYGSYVFPRNNIRKFNISLPWTKDITPDTELVIVSEEQGGKSPGFSEPFKLDTVGPKVEQSYIQKNQWGLSYDIKAKIEEAVGDIYIVDNNGYDKNDPSAKKPEAQVFKAPKDALEWLEYAWESKYFDPKKLEIIAFDKFNNRINAGIGYNDLKYLSIRAEESFAGDDFVNVNIEKGSFLNIIVKDDNGDIIHNQTVYIEDSIAHLEYKMIDLKDERGKAFELQEGHRIYYFGYQYTDDYALNSKDAGKINLNNWKNSGKIKAITRPFSLDVGGEW